MKHKNDLFAGLLMDIFDDSSLPTAVYSAADFVIHYANEAFVKLWKIESREKVSALNLMESAGNAAIMRALKSIGPEKAKISLTHTVGKAADGTFFESVFEKVATAPDFIIQTMHDVTRFQTEIEQKQAAVTALEGQNDDLYNELLRIGQELEESYIALENAGTRMLEILESISVEVKLPGIGYWSIDLDDLSLNFSKEAKRIHGIHEDASVSFDVLSQIIDKQHTVELEQIKKGILDDDKLHYFEYKINPLDGGPSKWLKSSGVVVGRDNDRITKIAGVMIVM